MKLFLREHRMFIGLQFIQAITVIFLAWMDGYKNMTMLLYIIFIGLFFSICYLLYYYITRKSLYEKFTKTESKLEDSLQPLGSAPLSEHIYHLFYDQYKAYEQRLITLESKQTQYLTYVDLWAHQMKTPLSVIELMAQQADEPLSSELRAETERMKHGLNMMLHMARLRTIDRDFHIKNIHVSSLLQEINQENRRYYIRNNIFPVVQLEDENITVQSDEKWLYFILEQLIHNAVKYSVGKLKKIVLAAETENNHVLISVTDRGIGIPLSDQKRIFEPFFTGENGRKLRESTGIGLYIVKEICTYLGHEIDVKSSESSGTTIRIII